jgi:GTPase SAR1 family protein
MKLKILLVGEAGTGKTGIMGRFVSGSSPRAAYVPTVGIDSVRALDLNFTNIHISNIYSNELTGAEAPQFEWKRL